MPAEIVARHEGSATAVVEGANRHEAAIIVAESAALLREALVAAALIAKLDASAAVAAIVDTGDLAIDPLLLAIDPVGVSAMTRLGVGYAPVAATTLLFRGPAVLGLEVGEPRPTTAFDALHLAIATAVALEIALLPTAPLSLHLTAATLVLSLLAATTVATLALSLLATAAATLTLSLLAATAAATSALLLSVLAGGATMAATALVGLRRCRRGNRKRRSTGYQDELPHLESPLVPCPNDAFGAPFHLSVVVRNK